MNGHHFFTAINKLKLIILLSFLSATILKGQNATFVWSKSFGGPNPANLWGASVTTDALGNVYTAGNLTSTADFDPGAGTTNLTSVGGVDLFISKLDASGNFVWAYRIGGSGGETAEGIVADASGNVYITGSFSTTVDFDPGAGTTNLTSSGFIDIYILKLNSSGIFQWARKIGGTGNDYGSSITLDPSGNVLFTGLFSNTVDFDPGAGITNLVSNGIDELFVAKLDATGSFIWAKSAGGTGNDSGHSISTDATGNAYITGSFSNTVDFDPGTGTNNLTANTSGNTFVLKLNADGSFGWAKNFSGALYNEGNAIAVDNNNNVLVAGLFGGTVDFDPGPGVFNQTEVSSDDFFISKLDASGNFVWAHGFGGNQEENANGIAVDGSGNTYTTGHFAATVDFDPGSGISNLSSTPSNAYDIYLLKLDASGNFVWVGQMGGANDFESGEAITLDGGGNIYTTGNFYGMADFDPNSGTSNLTGAGSGRNVFIQKLKTATSNFITQWNLATAGSGATQLSFGTATSGSVNYTWQEISPGSATGSGSWSGSPLTITGLPTGATIRLQIEPTNFQRIIINFGSDRNRLTQVENWGSTAWTSMQNAFLGCSNLQVTAADVPNLSGVTTMSQMFWLCTNLNSPNNINAWNTATVTDMSGMFSDASAFNQNIGSWNTSAVTTMQKMFFQASVFNQNIGAWNTGAVTDMARMFQGASAFNQNIGSWNTAAVNTMAFMFTSASTFNGNIGSWNTSAVTDMAGMFAQASSFNQAIGSWNTAAVTNMSSMFSRALAFNQNIGAWNTAAVIDMSNMFAETAAFNQTIGAWNTGAVINMQSMFYQAISFNQNIGTWNVSGVTTMRDMFYLAIAFNQNIGAWDVGAVTDMEGMFTETNAFNQNIGSWNTGAVTSMQNMFNRATAFNQNLGAWTLKPGVDLRNMFDDSGMQCYNYSTTLLGWNTNPATPDNLMLGANGRQYSTNAVAARTNLTVTKGWTITGDTPSGTVCSASPITITTQPSDFIACAGQIATFTTAATGTTNIIYRWQFSIDGVAAFTDINNGGGYSGATTATLTVNTTGNFGLGRYRCRINGDLAAEVITNDEGLFINPIPTAPTATNTSRCGPGSVTLTATGGSNGQYRWYTAATGGTAITGEVNSSYVMPAVTTSTTYFVAINNGSCESVRTPVVATINIPPAIPIITSSIAAVGNALTICSTTSLTLSAPAGFASYNWSTGATAQQISVGTSGNYSVTVTDAGGCASPASDAIIVTVVSAPCNNQAPMIATSTTSTIIGGQATINLLDLISDADDNIVSSSLVILQQPTSGALATIINGMLEIDYKGVNFSGRDQLTIQVCDVFGECVQQVLEIDVIGDIEIYNGISSNNDNQNEIFLIRNIDLLPDTRNNRVTIYNRWGSKVFEVSDYNNTTNVFKGLSENGSELPSGIYFYKIEFENGRIEETGYLSLKR